ncbi:MAG TPA: Rieske 2Fe-2S domain-containing protein [Terriglobales bacterium]|jgi:nitrite reductase/ring-hydroxylating ferredoxin subunit/uncharacterized membrane protein
MADVSVGEPAGVESHEEPKARPPKPIDEIVQKALDKALYANGNPVAQHIRDFLNGTWLGEPFHAALTDIPVGAWTAAMVLDGLDLAGRDKKLAYAADAAIAVGLAGAACAAVTGLADWSDVDPPARRTGMLHGLLNLGATVLMTTSLVLRKRGARKTGRVASTLGFATMSYAAHLGGQMVYDLRVGVDRTAGDEFPKRFTAVLAASRLPDGKPTRVMHDRTPILLVRRGERVFALGETCSHFSGPLSQGKLVDDCIECPYHSSRFALEDGCVVNGPAVHPLPCLDVRSRKGQIEVRRKKSS